LVEKRTLVFIILAIIVWAALASGFAGYYYLQNGYTSDQLNNAQSSLNKVASSYSEGANKYDLLLSEYASLDGDYSYFNGSDYSTFMPSLGSLIADFGKNYSGLFEEEDINKTYNQLLSDYEALLHNGNVTKTGFGNLLTEYYGLFNLSAMRQLGMSISETTSLSVSLEIDNNGTIEWHNETNVPAGYTLFRLTQEIAVTKYSYWPSLQPGHVLVDSINNIPNTSTYSWSWCYWSVDGRKWVPGPVGCDAWLLENHGIYKWSYGPPTFS
jgi:hypothetical protein